MRHIAVYVRILTAANRWIRRARHRAFAGVRNVVAKHGLFCSLYTDRGSHYFFTPEGGGPVSRTVLTQFGRALKQLGIAQNLRRHLVRLYFRRDNCGLPSPDSGAQNLRGGYHIRRG
jgi:hypothetical protein